MNNRITNLSHALKPVSLALAPLKTITVSSTAATLETLGSFTLDQNCMNVLITIETAGVREDPNGGTPTASVGHLRASGLQFFISSEEAKMAKWIRATGTDGVLTVSQFGS